MLTHVEKLRVSSNPVLQETITLELEDAVQYRHPWDLVNSVVDAFKRDAAWYNLTPQHVEGFNVGHSFYLSCWRFE